MALLLSQERRELLKPWIWAGLAIALLIFLPNVLWQVQNGYPTLEDLENYNAVYERIKRAAA